MGKFKDLTGVKMGNLTVVERGSNKGKKVSWNCICKCGKTTNVLADNLNNQHTKSCGCLIAQTYKETFSTHKMSKTKLFYIWSSMKARCNNPNKDHYDYYGGRGIKVCKEWNNSFESFYKWANSNGYKEGLSIERKDNDGDYKSTNCIWVPFKKQARNRRTTRLISFNSEEKCLADLAEQYNINYKLLWKRLKLGWSIEEAINTPKNIKKDL